MKWKSPGTTFRCVTRRLTRPRTATRRVWNRGQGSGNSVSVMGYHKGLRQAGAAAREMLVAAAAEEWGVPASECYAEQSRVWSNGRSLSYGELAGKAAAMPVPEAPRLKSREEFRLIGKHAPRKDSASKVMGTFPFMADSAGGDPALHAAVLNAPRRGARLKSLAYESPDGAWPKVMAIGDRAVAAVAEDYWTASSALAQADIVWGGRRHQQHGIGLRRTARCARGRGRPQLD